MPRYLTAALAAGALLWASFAAATVHWDDYRGQEGIPPGSVVTPNYDNYPNGPALQNLINFAAGGPGNIAASGTSAQVNWRATDEVLCNTGSNAGSASCLDGIMGRVAYALIRFPEAGTYTFSAAHDD